MTVYHDRTAKAALLEGTRLSKGLDWRDLLVLAGFMTYREHAAGEYLFEEGEPGTHLCVLLRGVLSVVKRRPDGEEVPVGDIHARAVVGELALLDGEPRSASVYAQTPVAVLVLSRKALERILEVHPRVGARFMAVLAREVGARLRLATGRLARSAGGDAFARPGLLEVGDLS